MSSEDNEHLISKKEPIYKGADALAPYPLSLSSPKIKPVDKRLTKANALEVMTYQAEQQITMLKKQAALLMAQAAEIQERINISHEIYKADLNFEPVIGTIYYVYEKADGSTILSLVSPEEWGKIPYKNYRCAVRLLADKSWEIQKEF